MFSASRAEGAGTALSERQRAVLADAIADGGAAVADLDEDDEGARKPPVHVPVRPRDVGLADDVVAALRDVVTPVSIWTPQYAQLARRQFLDIVAFVEQGGV